jgi:hypothetical protein
VNLLKRKLSHLEWVLQSLLSYMEILPDGGRTYEIVFSLAGHTFNPPSISGTWNQDSAMPPVTDPVYHLDTSNCSVS